jgi:hypothetical protein
LRLFSASNCFFRSANSASRLASVLFNALISAFSFVFRSLSVLIYRLAA